MSRGAQLTLAKTKDVKAPSTYISAMLGEYAQWSYDEVDAPTFKGLWRSKVFQVSADTPLDLEIGTGNGYHFAHYAQKCPNRRLVGIELKYKPLIQAIRRTLNGGAQNTRILRYNATLVDHLFAEEELNRVIIHFPDPWERQRQHKHRLIQDDFLLKLYRAQKTGEDIEFKTDNRNYFDWAIEKFKKSPYKIEAVSYDLHNSPYQEHNFITFFEKIFLAKGQPIHYASLRKI